MKLECYFGAIYEQTLPVAESAGLLSVALFRPFRDVPGAGSVEALMFSDSPSPSFLLIVLETWKNYYVNRLLNENKHVT